MNYFFLVGWHDGKLTKIYIGMTFSIGKIPPEKTIHKGKKITCVQIVSNFDIQSDMAHKTRVIELKFVEINLGAIRSVMQETFSFIVLVPTMVYQAM